MAADDPKRPVKNYYISRFYYYIPVTYEMGNPSSLEYELGTVQSPPYCS